MRRSKEFVVAVGLVLAVLGLVTAISRSPVWGPSEAHARPPSPVSRADQYARSCSPWRFYGFSDSDTTSDVVHTQSSTVPVLIPWGTQVEVSCEGVSGAYAVACFHQSSSMSLSLASGCGDGCGRIDDSSVTQDGHAACFLIPNGAWKFRRLDRTVFRPGGDTSSQTPLTREGSCAEGPFPVGAPCDVDSDCDPGFGGGSCVKTSRPTGAFMSIAVSDASLTCQVELCI